MLVASVALMIAQRRRHHRGIDFEAPAFENWQPACARGATHAAIHGAPQAIATDRPREVFRLPILLQEGFATIGEAARVWQPLELRHRVVSSSMRDAGAA